jgi:hypothetical protein
MNIGLNISVVYVCQSRPASGGGGGGGGGSGLVGQPMGPGFFMFLTYAS